MTQGQPTATTPPDVEIIQSLVANLYEEKTRNCSWGESSIHLKWKDGVLELITVKDETVVRPPSHKSRNRN